MPSDPHPPERMGPASVDTDDYLNEGDHITDIVLTDTSVLHPLSDDRLAEILETARGWAETGYPQWEEDVQELFAEIVRLRSLLTY